MLSPKEELIVSNFSRMISYTYLFIMHSGGHLFTFILTIVREEKWAELKQQQHLSEAANKK